MKIIVDVKVSAQLDRLILVPRDRHAAAMVKRKLSSVNPNVKFGRSVEGISVQGSELSNLNLENSEIDLRWNDLSQAYFQNRLRYGMVAQKVIQDIKIIRNGGKSVAKKYIKERPGFEILDDHQWVNVACMTLPESSGVCIFDEQGAGKTVTLIYAFDELVERDEVDFALIIAPKSMVSEWPVDFHKFMQDRYKVQTLTGSMAEKKLLIQGGSDVIVTNFETTVLMENEVSALIRSHAGRAMLVIDESFFVKNLDAKRTQAIRRLREYCRRAYVLCGTPAPNSPIDLIQQFNIVDFGVTFDGLEVPKDISSSAKLINSVIDEKGPFVRHLKKDVLPNLPKKEFNTVSVQMSPQQKLIYQTYAQELKSDLENIDDHAFEKAKLNYLTRRSALLQICSNPISKESTYNETPGKVQVIDELLSELIEKKKEKVILWSFYTETLSQLCARYGYYGAVRYDGSVTDTAVRREAVRRFREDSKTMLFIANPAAAGAGLNLQSARFAIYESMSNQAAHYLQSLDRIHRRGQNRNVEYLILICENTLEQHEYDRLVAKELTAQQLLGDDIVPISRKSILHELNGTTTLFQRVFE